MSLATTFRSQQQQATSEAYTRASREPLEQLSATRQHPSNPSAGSDHWKGETDGEMSCTLHRALLQTPERWMLPPWQLMPLNPYPSSNISGLSLLIFDNSLDDSASSSRIVSMKALIFDSLQPLKKCQPLELVYMYLQGKRSKQLKNTKWSFNHAHYSLIALI